MPQQPSARSHPTTTTTATATQTLTSTPVLRLRATASSPQSRRRIQWAEDVVDNEGLGRKRSKVCCIYHAPHPVGESSSESSSDSSSDGDSTNDDSGGSDGRARMGGKGTAKKQRHQHGETGDGCGHDHGDRGRGGDVKGRGQRRSGNAYETAPKMKTAEAKS